MVIPDIRSSDLMAPVQGRLSQTPFQMIVLFPIHANGRYWGVLSLRTGQREPGERTYIEKFGEICAQILSLSMAA